MILRSELCTVINSATVVRQEQDALSQTPHVSRTLLSIYRPCVCNLL